MGFLSKLFGGNKIQEEPPGVGLRLMALTTPPSKIGLTPDSDFPTVFGVLTDWDIGGAIASIMSMRNGTASLYTTTTFGVIGGEQHARVREAATRYVRQAETHAAASEPVTEFPYPANGQVHYYLLTYNGVRLCVGDEAALEAGSDPTLPLFEAAQDVMTELRLIAEGVQQDN